MSVALSKSTKAKPLSEVDNVTEAESGTPLPCLSLKESKSLYLSARIDKSFKNRHSHSQSLRGFRRHKKRSKKRIARKQRRSSESLAFKTGAAFRGERCLDAVESGFWSRRARAAVELSAWTRKWDKRRQVQNSCLYHFRRNHWPKKPLPPNWYSVLRAAECDVRRPAYVKPLANGSVTDYSSDSDSDYFCHSDVESEIETETDSKGVSGHGAVVKESGSVFESIAKDKCEESAFVECKSNDDGGEIGARKRGKKKGVASAKWRTAERVDSGVLLQVPILSVEMEFVTRGTLRHHLRRRRVVDGMRIVNESEEVDTVRVAVTTLPSEFTDTSEFPDDYIAESCFHQKQEPYFTKPEVEYAFKRLRRCARRRQRLINRQLDADALADDCHLSSVGTADGCHSKASASAKASCRRKQQWQTHYFELNPFHTLDKRCFPIHIRPYEIRQLLLLTQSIWDSSVAYDWLQISPMDLRVTARQWNPHYSYHREGFKQLSAWQLHKRRALFEARSPLWTHVGSERCALRALFAEMGFADIAGVVSLYAGFSEVSSVKVTGTVLLDIPCSAPKAYVPPLIAHIASEIQQRIRDVTQMSARRVCGSPYDWWQRTTMSERMSAVRVERDRIRKHLCRHCGAHKVVNVNLTATHSTANFVEDRCGVRSEARELKRVAVSSGAVDYSQHMELLRVASKVGDARHRETEQKMDSRSLAFDYRFDSDSSVGCVNLFDSD